MFTDKNSPIYGAATDARTGTWPWGAESVEEAPFVSDLSGSDENADDDDPVTEPEPGRERPDMVPAG